MVPRSEASRHFLWSSMKNMMYGTPVTSDDDFIARVHGAIKFLQDNRTYLVVCEVQHRRCRLCNDVRGTQFEPRL